jgi:hypothetical protein
MAVTYIDHAGTQGQTDFTFTFPYLEDEHIKVEIDGINTTDFTVVVTPTAKVVLDTGLSAAANVRVRRRSAPNENLVDFVNGSVLTEAELDLSYRHNRYLAEEIAELNDQSLQFENGGTEWDAKTKRIKNVGTAVDSTDAVTKAYLDNKVAQVSTGAAQPPIKWVFSATPGTNNTYTVTGAEVLGDTAYEVSIDGLIKEPTVEYTVDPSTDTLTIIPNMTGSEDIVVIQRGFGVAIAGTVGTNSLVDGSVTNAKLASGSVTNAKLANGAVTTTKLADGNVTAAKISNTDSTFSIDGNGNMGLGISATSAAKLYIAGTGGNTFLAVKSDTMAAIDLEDSGAGVNQKHYQMVSLDGAFEVRQINDDLTLKATPLKVDANGDVDITGAYKVNNTELLLDEDDMVSNSATQGVTQQSIKAYVDSNSGGGGSGGTPNWNSGWFNDTTGLSNGGTYTFTHNLGSENLTFDLYVSSSSSGTNPQSLVNESGGSTATSDMYGAVVTNITSTEITVQLGNLGYLDANSLGAVATGNFSGVYIKVVASASATVGALSKYSSSWFNDSGTGLTNGSNYTFNHGLGTSDVDFKVYVSSSSSGTNPQSLTFMSQTLSINYGLSATNVTSSNITIQLGASGYADVNSTGTVSVETFAGKFIKVVVIG